MNTIGKERYDFSLMKSLQYTTVISVPNFQYNTIEYLLKNPSVIQ